MKTHIIAYDNMSPLMVKIDLKKLKKDNSRICKKGRISKSRSPIRSMRKKNKVAHLKSAKLLVERKYLLQKLDYLEFLKKDGIKEEYGNYSDTHDWSRKRITSNIWRNQMRHASFYYASEEFAKDNPNWENLGMLYPQRVFDVMKSQHEVGNRIFHTLSRVCGSVAAFKPSLIKLKGDCPTPEPLELIKHEGAVIRKRDLPSHIRARDLYARYRKHIQSQYLHLHAKFKKVNNIKSEDEFMIYTIESKKRFCTMPDILIEYLVKVVLPEKKNNVINKKIDVAVKRILQLRHDQICYKFNRDTKKVYSEYFNQRNPRISAALIDEIEEQKITDSQTLFFVDKCKYRENLIKKSKLYHNHFKHFIYLLEHLDDEKLLEMATSESIISECEKNIYQETKHEDLEPQETACEIAPEDLEPQEIECEIAPEDLEPQETESEELELRSSEQESLELEYIPREEFVNCMTMQKEREIDIEIFKKDVDVQSALVDLKPMEDELPADIFG